MSWFEEGKGPLVGGLVAVVLGVLGWVFNTLMGAKRSEEALKHLQQQSNENTKDIAAIRDKQEENHHELVALIRDLWRGK